MSAVIDIDVARNKHVVVKAETFELFLFDDRRPDLYESITAQATAGVPPMEEG